MKVSVRWLERHIDLSGITPEQLCDDLTLSTAEVEGLERFAPQLADVVVGHVEGRAQHPDADKLKVCQVTDGKDSYSVVCGASNVRAEMKVAFARIGAELPGIKIKKAKLRGVESQGMICSAAELQLTESSVGILELPDAAPPGVSIVEYLRLDDNIIDINLTPNRGDCLSIAGVAREVSAINQVALTPTVLSTVDNSIYDGFTIELAAPGRIPPYVVRNIKGIGPQATKLLWIHDQRRSW